MGITIQSKLLNFNDFICYYCLEFRFDRYFCSMPPLNFLDAVKIIFTLDVILEVPLVF